VGCTEEERVIYLVEKKGAESSGGYPGEGVGNPWWVWNG